MPIDFLLNKVNDLATREQLVEIIKELGEKLKNLENRLLILEDWNNKSALYAEFEIFETGAVVIKHKDKKFFYCPVCFDTKRIIALQPYGNLDKQCPNCKTVYDFTKVDNKPAQVSYDPFERKY